MNLQGRHLLKMRDFTAEEINYLIDLAIRLKREKKAGIDQTAELRGKNIALIFEKSSTRTRCAFEVAAADLGMHSTYLEPTGSQIGKKESIKDTARVLGSMYDGIEYRGFGQAVVEELAEYAGVPVWNGLTDEAHPTQMIADMMTIKEHLGEVAGKKFVLMGDGSFNMGNSLMVTCAKLGMHYVSCSHPDCFPGSDLVSYCRQLCETSGGSVTLTSDVAEACKEADVIYTDVWVSMGEPPEIWEKRIQDLLPYQVNGRAMAYAKDTCLFMHCLPAFHDLGTGLGRQIYEKFGLAEMEVTDEVFESPASVVFEEAENRMHSIKAIIYATMPR